MSEQEGRTIEMKEQTEEVVALYVGRLGDLGLGNEDGIPSDLAERSEADLQQYAEFLQGQLVEVTDTVHLSCIDGRHVDQNEDGTAPDVRARRVGGSASNLEVALNADASVMDTLKEASMSEAIEHVDDFMEKATGKKPSAHEGGCGGANGAPEDNENIGTKPEIMGAVQAFMEIPQVFAATGVTYDEQLGKKVAENAGKTAQYLSENGWSGQKYVDGVRKKNPHGDEDLTVDHHDEKFHGHKERAVAAVLGDKTLAIDDIFVWNVQASIEAAKALAGQRGEEGYQQALIAEFAKHLAVCYRLPSKKTPLLLVA